MNLSEIQTQWNAACAQFDRYSPIASAKYKAMFAGAPKKVKGFAKAKEITDAADAKCAKLRAAAFENFNVWLEWPRA
jgi:hypothetical protein